MLSDPSSVIIGVYCEFLYLSPSYLFDIYHLVLNYDPQNLVFRFKSCAFCHNKIYLFKSYLVHSRVKFFVKIVDMVKLFQGGFKE